VEENNFIDQMRLNGKVAVVTGAGRGDLPFNFCFQNKIVA